MRGWKTSSQSVLLSSLSAINREGATGGKSTRERRRPLDASHSGAIGILLLVTMDSNSRSFTHGIFWLSFHIIINLKAGQRCTNAPCRHSYRLMIPTARAVLAHSFKKDVSICSSPYHSRFLNSDLGKELMPASFMYLCCGESMFQEGRLTWRIGAEAAAVAIVLARNHTNASILHLALPNLPTCPVNECTRR